MKIKIQKGYSSPNNKAVAIYGHPGFNNVQDDMEREAERRKMEWEKEVSQLLIFTKSILRRARLMSSSVRIRKCHKEA